MRHDKSSCFENRFLICMWKYINFFFNFLIIFGCKSKIFALKKRDKIYLHSLKSQMFKTKGLEYCILPRSGPLPIFVSIELSSLEVFQAHSTGLWPRCRPRTSGRDYTPHLARDGWGVPQGEQEWMNLLCLQPKSCMCTNKRKTLNRPQEHHLQ